MDSTRFWQRVEGSRAQNDLYTTVCYRRLLTKLRVGIQVSRQQRTAIVPIMMIRTY